VEIPSQGYRTELEVHKEGFAEALQHTLERAVWEGKIEEIPDPFDRPKFLHPTVTEAAYLVEVSGVPQMEDNGLQPEEFEAYRDDDSGELWIQVWLAAGDDLEDRLAQALDVLKSEVIEEHDTLPSVVNANYQTDPDTRAVSAWWH
jgi:hypothetical protein